MTAPPKKRSWRKITLIVIGLLLLLCVVGWFWINATIKSQLEGQLADAGLSSAKVGSVQTGFGGFTARHINFESYGAKTTLESLEVHQPIFSLIRGDVPMDEVCLQGGTIEIDSQQLTDDSTFSFADIDLEKLQLPAKKISSSNLKFKLYDNDGSVDIAIDDVSLTSATDQFSLDGSATFLDGELEFAAAMQRSGDLNIEFSGNQLHLVDQHWQRWPGIGPAVLRHLGADSVFDTDGVVSGNLKSGINYKADVTTKDARLYIPKFDLPIAIRSAEILIQDGLVTYQKVHAAMGDKDIVNGTGTTTIDGLPCVSKFTGDFKDVDVADLRKLVKEIPTKVSGTATGKVTGSVHVDEVLDTTLRLSASGDTKEAFYGQIKADTGFVDVQIQPLVISPLGKTLDLKGSVNVDATTRKQNVDGVLDTFDLQALDQQFEFEMLGDGEVALVIPLDSAADLRTWTLDIGSTSDVGSVGGMELENLKVNSFLEDGQLVFKNANGNLKDNPDAKVNVNVRWPMPNRAAKEIRKTGTIEASGVNLPPEDAVKFFSRQMLNAKIDYKFQSQIDALAKSGIKGGINFTSTIEIPSGSDRPVESWIVDAQLSNSTASLSNESIRELTAAVAIRDGVLQLTELKGNVDNGGSIKANAALALGTSELISVGLKANRFPALWLAQAMVREDSSGKFVDRTGLNVENVSEQLSGFFNANIEMDPADPNNILWNARSDELTIFGNPFRGVTASGHYDTQLDIEIIHANLPGGGEAHLEGDWIAGIDRGKFNLKWNDAAVVPLLKSQIQLPDSFTSRSDGELEITFRDGRPEFDGEFDLIKPKLFGGSFADHRFEIKTENDRILFRDIPDPKSKTVSLVGSFSMEKPFDFEVKGSSESLPLSTSALDQLSGNATLNFTMSGQASPWNIQSSGRSRFANLRFDKSKLSNIRTQWNFDTSKPENIELSFEGFGGKAGLDPTTTLNDNLVFNVADLDLGELGAFRKLPVEFSGNVTGTATLENWQSPTKQAISLVGESKTIRVGNARLNRTTGIARISNAGQDLEYSFESQLIDGKLQGSGKTRLDSDPFASSFPLSLRLTNGRLIRFAESISQRPMDALRELQGRVSVSMDWEVTPGNYPKGSGTVSLDDVKYRNRLVSRKISSDISLDDGIMQLKRISADLQQGQISGQATIPLVGSASGNYQLNVRNFSLPRLLHVFIDDPVEASGLVNARISGRTGRTITGSGTLGVSQAGLFGVASESMKVPVRFRIEPLQRKARIEMPDTRVKAFRGTLDGSAKMIIGSRLQIESELELSNIDSQTFIRAVTGYRKQGTGKLSGKLELSARNFRSERDLAGSFRGELKQSNALSLPILDQLSRFLGNAGTLRSDRFESDSIELSLAKGRIDVRQFRLQNALTSILITGDAWLNGKLDLEVAARVERLNQPTLIDQLAGSPIARAVGPQAAFFAQAADFLSERIVFLDVTGTANRPQFRLNPGKQLREEAIRYFLRGSQILPNANGQNN